MRDLAADNLELDEIEAVEKITLRLIVQALVTFGTQAWIEFRDSPDKEQDIAQDVLRDSLDEFAGFNRRQRILGTVDYRKARWLPTPFGLVPQALYVDAKASREDYRINLQLSQISIAPKLRHRKTGEEIHIEPGVPWAYPFLLADGVQRNAITTTVFAQMIYKGATKESSRLLQSAQVVVIPNGRLTERYAHGTEASMFRVGKHSPARDEAVRTRVSIPAMSEKVPWRVQTVTWGRAGEVSCEWQDQDAAGNATSHPVVADVR